MPEFNEATVIKAIHRMRSIGTDTQRWEVKESVQELPKKLRETISAFSILIFPPAYDAACSWRSNHFLIAYSGILS